MDLVDWYIAYLQDHPDHGPIKAICAGFDAFGRTFGTPDIASHRAAYNTAKRTIEEEQQ